MGPLSVPAVKQPAGVGQDGETLSLCTPLLLSWAPNYVGDPVGARLGPGSPSLILSHPTVLGAWGRILACPGPCAHGQAAVRLGPPHWGPVAWCPEGRLSSAFLLTQQPCLSVPAPSCLCWLVLPAPGFCPPLSSPAFCAAWSPLCHLGMLGAKWPPSQGLVWLSPRKALLDMRAVLCHPLPAFPSGPMEHTVPPQWGEGHALLAKGALELEQSCQLGFHGDTGACERQAMQLSPHPLSGGASVPRPHPDPMSIALGAAAMLGAGWPQDLGLSECPGGPGDISASPSGGSRKPGMQRPLRVRCAGSVGRARPPCSGAGGLPAPLLLAHREETSESEGPRLLPASAVF